ncbi:hypothetical protein AAFX24_27845 [Vibrio mediterranei]
MADLLNAHGQRQQTMSKQSHASSKNDYLHFEDKPTTTVMC